MVSYWPMGYNEVKNNKCKICSYVIAYFIAAYASNPICLEKQLHLVHDRSTFTFHPHFANYKLGNADYAL